MSVISFDLHSPSEMGRYYDHFIDEEIKARRAGTGLES